MRTHSIENRLKKIRFTTPKLLAVSINTHQGSYSQAELIVSRLQEYSKKFECPVYTFAEDIALGPGYFILASGNRVFADTFSIVGGITASLSTLNLIDFAKKYEIKPETSRIGKYKVRINPFEEVSKENSDWVNELLNYKVEKARNHVFSHRGHRIPREKAKEDQAMSGEVFTGNQAVDLGLVDSLSVFRNIYNKEYYDCRIVEIIKKHSKNSPFCGGNISYSQINSENFLEYVNDLPSKTLSERLVAKPFMLNP